MILIDKELRGQDVIKDIICDCCGKSCSTEYGGECMKLSANWGFMSNKDLQLWEARICEQCVDEKLGFIKFSKQAYGRL